MPIKETASMPQFTESGVAKKIRGGKLFNIVIVIIIIVLVALFAWSEKSRRDQARQLKQASQKLNELTSSNQKRMEEIEKDILDKVGKHVEIPSDPKPVILTILDADKLKKDNPFYEKTENGDQLIVTQKWAVLYSPKRDKIYGASSVTPEQASEVQNQANGTNVAPSVSPAASPSATAKPK
jgi:hypothetical protein